MTLTVQSLMATMKRVEAMRPEPQPRVVFTPYALKDTDQRLFPASRNRSKRIEKKLIKRHGGIYRKQPCMWRVADVIYAHPAYKAEFQRLPVVAETRRTDVAG